MTTSAGHPGVHGGPNLHRRLSRQWTQRENHMQRIMMKGATVLATLALAACGSGSDKGSTGGDHNSADIAFAQGMVPHHEQAIEMADLAATRAAGKKVKALATQIDAAQDPEIKQMAEWLKAWGEPTVDPDSGGGHGSASGHARSGMMSDADMAKLAGLSGAAFDKEFLTMMTAHHKGAIEMARTEQADGRYGPAKQLAANIIKSQTTEVTVMADLLKAM